ncbi:hypothetical protein RB653_005687 [Dictyostelium firmibasis]|uniref:Uncharacterized protein n=1 Tax=Dictyostelium firmibasis TaxID=79012 RepID=A0AAN7UAN2_9MYCE
MNNNYKILTPESFFETYPNILDYFGRNYLFYFCKYYRNTDFKEPLSVFAFTDGLELYKDCDGNDAFCYLTKNQDVGFQMMAFLMLMMRLLPLDIKQFLWNCHHHKRPEMAKFLIKFFDLSIDWDAISALITSVETKVVIVSDPDQNNNYSGLDQVD